MTDPNQFKLNRGPLFRENRKTNPKAPDWRGHIELDSDLLQKLVQMYKNRQPIKLELSGWDSMSNKGASYIGLQAQEPFKPADNAAPRQPAPSPAPRRPEPAPRRSVRGILDDDIPF